MAHNPYDELELPRTQCNNPSAAGAAERSAEKRRFGREVKEASDEAARAEMVKHRAKQ